MKNVTSKIILIIFLQLSCISKIDDTTDGVIKYTALKEDFKILRKTLEEAHPGLYWYSDKKALDDYFDSTYISIDHAMTSIDFFKVLLPVIAHIKCVHTNLQLPHNNDSSIAHFKHLLPYEFFCQKGKLYIRKDLTGNGHEGAEVLSINNIQTKKIFETLLNCIPADGYNETFKYNLLSNGAFREGYALLFGQPETFSIEGIEAKSQKIFSSTVQAASPAKLTSTKIVRQPIILNFQASTAILTLNTFEIDTNQFNDSLETIFKKIYKQRSKHLIIDLRQNGGGINDNVSKLYSYIATAPFRHLKRAEMNGSPITYGKFINNTQNIPNPANPLDSNGKYLVNHKYPGTALTKPVNAGLFKGNVVILTSGNTTSAASEFAAIARFLKRATIIGEETGGCYYGATGGNYLNLRLPNSGLEVRIPTIRILTAVSDDYIHHPKGHGTLPDHEILPNVNDFIAGGDRQLEMTLKIIGK